MIKQYNYHVTLGYEVSDQCRKNLHNPHNLLTRDFFFFLRCGHLHIPDESPKKSCCLNNITNKRITTNKAICDNSKGKWQLKVRCTHLLVGISYYKNE